MDDTISRQEIIKFLRDKVSLSTFMKRTVSNADKACIELCERIKNEVPSAQPERKKGKWVDLKCDQCGQVDTTKPNFCPNCGADMREETGCD